MIVLCTNPACKAPIEREDTIGGLCPTCLANGAPVQLGPLDKLTERNLTRGDTRVSRSTFNVPRSPKHTETPPRAVEREETMPQERVNCPHCGKDVSKGNLYNHTHKACPKRPGAEAPVEKVVKLGVRAKRPVKRKLSRALVALAGKVEKTLTTSDAVNHPAHYNKGKIEVIDFIEDQNLGFHLGNVVKYLCRQTDPADLRKAAWYLERYIAQQERRAAA